MLADTYDDPTFGVPTWTNNTNTPALVKQAIAMTYAGWFYDRQYSEMVIAAGTGRGGDGTTYGQILRDYAESLVAGIITSSILLQEVQPNVPQIAPVFYPDDASSTRDALRANTDPDDTSLGPHLFGVSKIF